MIRAANNFIEERDLDIDIRFDVIGILKGPQKMSLKHIEDAFYPLA